MSLVRSAIRFCAVSAVALCLATSVFAPPALAQDRALVVVNSDYRDLEDFEAGASGTAVADALREAGFDVTLIEDATTGGILAALRTLGQDADPDAAAVFYYSGYVRQARKRNYIIARDAKPSAPFDFITQGVGVDAVLRSLADGAGRLQLAVIDGAYPEATLDALPGLEPGLAGMDAGPSQAVVIGTPQGLVLDDAETVERFAMAFAGALRSASAPISAVFADFESRLFETTERRAETVIGGDRRQPLATPEVSIEAQPVEQSELEKALTAGLQSGADTGTPDEILPPEGEATAGGTFQQAPQVESVAETPSQGDGVAAGAGDGATSEDVFALDSRADRERVQIALKSLGLYPGAIDGIHGAGTRRGISTFQRLRSFPVTGELTNAQANLLFELSGQ